MKGRAAISAAGALAQKLQKDKGFGGKGDGSSKKGTGLATTVTTLTTLKKKFVEDDEDDDEDYDEDEYDDLASDEGEGEHAGEHDEDEDDDREIREVTLEDIRRYVSTYLSK